MTMGQINNIEVGTAVAYLKLQELGFFDEIKKAQSAMQNFQDSSETQVSTLEKFSSVTSNMGSSITRGLTVPIANFAKSAISDFEKTESALTGVRKTVDEADFADAFGKSADGWAKIDDAIWRISQETSTKYEDVAAVMEWAGQLGIELGKDGENIAKFTKVMVNMGRTTDLSSSQAAESLAKFMNIMNTSQGDVDKLASTVVDLGNNYATTEAQIVPFMMRLAGVGKSAGLTEADIAGIATALSAVGLTAEMGGSAFGKAIKKMQTAAETGYEPVIKLQKETGMSLRELQLLSSNNSKDFKALADSLGYTSEEMLNMIKAGDNLNSFAEVANMTTEDFVKLYRKDVPSALQAFIAGLGDTETHGQSTIQMLQEMGFTEVRLSDTLIRAAQSGTLFSDAIADANKAWEENNALAIEAAKRDEDLAAQIERLRQTWRELKVDLVELVVPTLRELLEILQKVINWVKELPDWLQGLFVHGALLVAALGPILSILGKISGAIINIQKLWGLFKNLGIIKKVGEIVKGLGGGQGLLGIIQTIWNTLKSFWAVFGQAIQVISGLAAIIAGPMIALKNFVDMLVDGVNLVDAGWTLFGTTLAGIGALLLGLTGPVGAVIIAISGAVLIFIAWLKEHWEEVKTFFSNLCESIGKFFSDLWNGLVEGVTNIVHSIVEAFNGFLDWWFGLGESIKEIWGKIWDAIFGFVYDIIDKIHTAINKWFLETFGNDGYITGIPAIIHDIVGGIIIFIKSTVELIGNLFKDFFNILVDLFTGNFEKLLEDLKALWGHVSSWFNDIWESISTLFRDIWDLVTSSFSDITKSVKEFFSGVWDSITEWFGNFLGGVAEFFGNLVRDIVEHFNTLREAIHNAFEAVSEVIQSVIEVVRGAFEAFVDFISSAVENIRGIIEDVVSAIQTFVETAAEAIGTFFSNIFGAIEELWTSLTGIISEVFENITSFLKDAFSKLWDWISGLPKKFVDIGKGIIENLWDGLKSVWDNVSSWFEEKFGWISDLVEKIKGAVGGIKDKASSLLPKHANGLDYVPYDNYVAQLHQGERVLTKQEARDYNNGNHGTGGDTFNFYNTKPDPYEYARQMKRVKKEIQFG